MTYRTRTYYTDSQKALMWERWKEGDSLQQIAQLFDRSHSSIEGILARTGGTQPPVRHRCALALTLAEREEVSRSVVAGFSIRAIASILGRAPSTVSREIKRNGGEVGYRAAQADQAAWNRACRPKSCKLAENRALARIVADKLQSLWSPEQIAGWLKHTYSCDEDFQVSPAEPAAAGDDGHDGASERGDGGRVFQSGCGAGQRGGSDDGFG
jgi:IS30 family transposase